MKTNLYLEDSESSKSSKNVLFDDTSSEVTISRQVDTLSSEIDSSRNQQEEVSKRNNKGKISSIIKVKGTINLEN